MVQLSIFKSKLGWGRTHICLVGPVPRSNSARQVLLKLTRLEFTFSVDRELDSFSGPQHLPHAWDVADTMSWKEGRSEGREGGKKLKRKDTLHCPIGPPAGKLVHKVSLELCAVLAIPGDSQKETNNN